MQTLLECTTLKKAWGGVRALDGVELLVAPGEILGLAGPNGAGKTTFLNSVAGQVTLDDGSIIFKGRPVERLTPVARRRLGIARTFQAVRIFTRKTTLQNVALAAEYGARRMPPLWFSREAIRQAREALRLVGLEPREDVIAGELSVYEQKRLMIAMAIVPQPVLLLLDEPAAGLSPVEVDETVGALAKVRALGITVIVVDHVMSFLRQVVDRMVVFHEGTVLVEGHPDDVVNDARVREIWLGGPAEGAVST